jgi:glycosyltransferase involved in cell wall biosynthesis
LHRDDINTMRIVHIVPAITDEASGPSYTVARLCEELMAQQHQVTLAVLDFAASPRPPEFVRTFPMGNGLRRLGHSPSMRRWLYECCEAGDADVLHNHGMWQMNAIYPAWAARRGSIQLVCSPRGALSEWSMRHGSRAKFIFWSLLQRPALRRATCFHATAESEYCDIRRLGFRQPIAIIPNGIDLPPRPDRAQTERRTLLFLGRIHVVKGLDMLLPAWRAVQQDFPGWRLVIAGTDDGYHGSTGYLAEIKARVQQLGLQRVEFVGGLYGDNKLQAYRDSDLYVLPSYSENFGVTVAEALSMSLPVIVSKGAPWAGLQQVAAGWWIDIGVDPLVVCLKDALSRSSAELAVMGERGRSWMQKDFSWGSIGVQMAATYRWLCDRSEDVPPWVRLN